MSYVVAGYGITLAAIAAYTWRLLRRERILRAGLRKDQSS
jgi:hypothetical protein